MKSSLKQSTSALILAILSSCGQNSHITLDAVTAPTDTTAPSVSVNAGLLDVNNSNKGAYTVSGTCEAGAGDLTVTIAGQNPTTTPVTCSGAGTWSATFDLTSVVDSSSLAVSASQTDAAGNTGTGAATVAKDTVVPVVNSVVVQSPSTIDVTFSEALGSGALTAGNYVISGMGQGTLSANPTSVVWVSGNTYRLSFSGGEMFTGGNINVAVSGAADAAGNVLSSSGTHVAGGLGVAPTITSNAAGSGSAAFGATVGPSSSVSTVLVFSELITTATLTASDFDNTLLNGATIAGISCSTVASHTECTVSLNLATATGNPRIELSTPVVTDLAGNPMSTTALPTTASWVLDNTAPLVTITHGLSPLSGTTLDPVNNSNKSAYSVSGACEAGAGNLTVTVAGQSPTTIPITCSGAGTWSATFNLTSVADSSSLAVSASQTDTAGNTGSDSESAAKDTIAPTIASDAPGTGGAAFGSTIDSSSTVNVQITFSEAIQTSTLSAADFDPSSPGDVATISGVSCASSTVCTVTLNVTSVTSSGTVSLQLNSPSILDTAGNNLSTTTLPSTATWNFSALAVGASQLDYCWDVVVDADDNRICSGITNGNLADTHGGNGDIFLMKRNSSGNVVWIKQLGQTYASLGVGLDASGADVTQAMVLDLAGNIYITGYTSSSLGEVSAFPFSNFFVAKFNSEGDLQWLKQAGSGAFGALFNQTSAGNAYAGNAYGRDIVLDSSGNLIIVGDTDYDFIEDKLGGRDPFVIKMNTDGDLIWTRQFGQGAFGSSLGILQQSATNYIVVSSVVTDSMNNIYFSGNNVSNNESDSGIFQTIDQKEDPFLISMDVNGNYLNGKQIDRGDSGGTDTGPCMGWGSDRIKDLAITNDSRIFALADWSVNQGMDGSGGCYGVWSNTEIIEFNTSFNELSNKLVGEQNNVTSTWFDAWKILLSRNQSNLFIAGNTTLSLGEDNSGGCSTQNLDVYLMKYDIPTIGIPVLNSGTAQAGSGTFGISHTQTNQYDECRSIAEDSTGKLICSGFTYGNLNNTYLGGSGDAMMMVYDPSLYNWTSSPITACTIWVYGCMDPGATNYNPSATIDDGSCTYGVYGCMDPGATNYNPSATIDDGSCIY